MGARQARKASPASAWRDGEVSERAGAERHDGGATPGTRVLTSHPLPAWGLKSTPCSPLQMDRRRLFNGMVSTLDDGNPWSDMMAEEGIGSAARGGVLARCAAAPVGCPSAPVGVGC
ncbi:hypothetical protein ColTof3_14460 [Colletotrichum tofieldiae]|nr:hypothetical protein ColTof3_14460 [Colletotrichum tofieldiae]